jgi:hypothetical protein
MLCPKENETRFIPLYVFGSEGLYVCHECEMQLVEYARLLSRKNGKNRVAQLKSEKKSVRGGNRS